MVLNNIYKLLGPSAEARGQKILYLSHLKKSQRALGSFERPSPLAQHQNCRPRFGPFFFTVLKTQISLCPLQTGAAGGPFIIFFQAVAVFRRFSSISGFMSGASPISNLSASTVFVWVFCFMKKLEIFFCWTVIFLFFPAATGSGSGFRF